jgi:heat shock protein HtpX
VFVVEGTLIVALATVLRFRFREKSLALGVLMGLMFAQCIALVFALHFQVLRIPTHSDLAGSASWLLQILLGVDWRLAELGVPAAICIGLYFEFVHTRLNLSRTFPNMTFCEPTSNLTRVVRGLADTAQIERPNICLVDSGTPSAFTFRTKGRYTIAVSIGLMESFEENEVEACIAHEISHIKNGDFTLRAIITMARVALFSRFLSYFVETAFYRTRELLADRTATMLIGSTRPLISALTKLQVTDLAVANLSRVQICCLDGKKSAFGLLSKHPSLRMRIRMLKQLHCK